MEPQLPLQLAGHSILTVGLSPTVNAGAGISLGFRWYYSSFAAEGRFLAPLGTFDVRPGQRANVMLGIGILSWCLERAHPILLCLLIEGGRMNVASMDPQPRIQTPFFAAAGARLGFVHSFAHFAHLRAFLEPAATPVGAEFALDGKPLWTSPLFSVGFGVEVALGPLDPASWGAPAGEAKP